MKARNWGRIINIASTHGLVASAQKAAYVAAKHGILGLTKVVALETATTGHHLQRDLSRLGADAARAEADRRSRRGRSSLPMPARMKLLGEKQPSLEFATPEQIGAAALFLCSHGRGADPRHRAAGRRRLDRPMKTIFAEGRRRADPRRRERDDRRLHGRRHARAPGGRAGAPGQAQPHRHRQRHRDARHRHRQADHRGRWCARRSPAISASTPKRRSR